MFFDEDCRIENQKVGRVEYSGDCGVDVARSRFAIAQIDGKRSSQIFICAEATARDSGC